jgi:hypothetical protein
MLPRWVHSLGSSLGKLRAGIWRRLDRHASLVAQAQAQVDFPILQPAKLPRGYSLWKAEWIPYARDLVFLSYRGAGHKSFRFTQRIGTVSLAEELRATRVPYEVVDLARKYFIVLGAYDGEPGDVWHWHATRRVIKWEQDGMLCDIAIVLVEGPSVEDCVRIATSVRRSNGVGSTQQEVEIGVTRRASRLG